MMRAIKNVAAFMFLLVVSTAAPRFAFGIPQLPWGSQGIIVSSEINRQSAPTIVPSGSSDILVTWYDLRLHTNNFFGSSETIYAQKISGQGQQLWPQAGVMVTTSTSTDHFLSVSDGSDGMIVAFGAVTNFPIGNLDIFVQRIDPNGNRLWGDHGVLVSSTSGSKLLRHAITDELGGALLSFSCFPSGCTRGYYAQRVNDSGAALWGIGGVLVTTTTPSNYFVSAKPVHDGSGGVVIAWTDDRKINGGGNGNLTSGTSIDTDIYVQKFNSAGVAQWGANGLPIAVVSNQQYLPAIAKASTTNETLIAWADARSGNYDVYAQKIDSAGGKLWTENGIPIFVGPGNQHPVAVVADGSDGFIILLGDDSNGSIDIYAQRISGSGQILWQTSGIKVMATSTSQTWPSVTSDENGGAVVASGNRAQHITSSGQRLWPAGGFVFDSAARIIETMLTVDSNTFVAVWEDRTRESGESWQRGDILMQRIDDLSGPEPPSNLTATSLNGRKIRLDWTVSPSSTASHYNIYFDSGTGVIDYSVRLTSVAASSTTFTTGALTLDVTYKFGLRTVDDNGVEELNTDVVASATALESLSAAVQAAIKVPKSGKRVAGNRTLIMAEIVQGSIASVKNVRFQYRSAISTTTPWSDVTPATVQHPNPDTGSPYFVHWDVSAFSEGVYELRAVATNGVDVADPSPPTIFITIDHADPDSEEVVSGSGLRKREKVNNSVTNTVRVGDPTRSIVTNVSVPATALSASTTTLRVLTVPTAVPVVPGDFAASGIFTEITLESGQTSLSNGQLATLTMTYPDANNDGIVDIGGVREESLALYRFNTAANRWDKLPGSVDAANNTVTAQSPGFSVFGLFAPAAADLSDVLVYPVPWVPNDGNNDNGKPYSASDPSSGIIFENLTQGVKIEVFTVTGELVWEHSTDASSNKVRWDARNKSGRDVASGGYFAVITDKGSGNKVVRKIAIIR